MVWRSIVEIFFLTVAISIHNIFYVAILYIGTLVSHHQFQYREEYRGKKKFPIKII